MCLAAQLSCCAIRKELAQCLEMISSVQLGASSIESAVKTTKRMTDITHPQNHPAVMKLTSSRYHAINAVLHVGVILVHQTEHAQMIRRELLQEVL